MLAFIARRLFISFWVLLAGTYVMYLLVANAGDPLADLRLDTSPDRQAKIDARIDALHLDTPAPLRYFIWLRGVSGCLAPAMECSLGLTAQGQDVKVLIGNAAVQTLQLVAAATVVALMLGVLTGIVTALRQYSSLDYSATFVSFLFFSLPIFWVAVLLKQYLAIEFNDWLADPVFGPAIIGLVGLLSGVVWMVIVGGDRERRLVTFLAASFAGAGAAWVVSVTRWFESPTLGPVVVGVTAVGLAVLVTALLVGLRHRRVLAATIATAGAGIAFNLVFDRLIPSPDWLVIGSLLLLAIAVSAGIGAAIGGVQRRQAVTASVVTGVSTGGVIMVDRLLGAWQTYAEQVGGRPIATFGARTPNFEGDFWLDTLDTATHVLLPTIAIALISFATYSRYTRASMLETMNQDYVRTARSKGLTERTVVLRHAFRNALIPITTLAAFDFAGVVGGAVITENVFGWQGMGKLFIERLITADPNPVMAFFLITGGATVVFNMLADIGYAYLDPRIRL